MDAPLPRTSTLRHGLSLAGTLAVLWMLLSGHTEPLLLGLGAVSVLLVGFLAHRMDVSDHEGHPLHLGLRAIPYWLWLAVEICKANVDVARRILRPGRHISPVMLRVRATQTTDVGRVLFANSITLTPGTVSMHVDGEWIEVHALTREGAEGVLGGDMDRRASAVEAP